MVKLVLGLLREECMMHTGKKPEMRKRPGKRGSPETKEEALRQERGRSDKRGSAQTSEGVLRQVRERSDKRGSAETREEVL